MSTTNFFLHCHSASHIFCEAGGAIGEVQCGPPEGRTAGASHEVGPCTGRRPAGLAVLAPAAVADEAARLADVGVELVGGVQQPLLETPPKKRHTKARGQQRSGIFRDFS